MKAKRFLVVSLLAFIGSFLSSPLFAGPFSFQPPQLLKSTDGALRSDPPGYAAPCWGDMDGDGKNELLVGQFSQGYIKVYKAGPDGVFQKGEYLQVNGAPAKIPGVW